jgi:hypothetical protein
MLLAVELRMLAPPVVPILWRLRMELLSKAMELCCDCR